MKLMDLRVIDDSSSISCDLCIVGSGPAGVSIAREFAGSNVEVLVVEAGGWEQTPADDAVLAVENTGVARATQDRVRNRVVGGTSHTWSGRCVSLDEIDFQLRAWVPGSGWPVAPAELGPFLERSREYLGLGPNVYDDGLWKLLRTSPPATRFAPEVLKPQFWQYSKDERNPLESTRFRHTLESIGASNVTLLLHANVTHVNADEDGGRITSLDVRTHEGCRAEVKAAVFVLAGGGLENARLLLASNRQIPVGLGNAHDLVGRFLMDHPGCTLGWFDPARSGPIQDRFGTWLLDHERGRNVYISGLALSAEVQRREQLLNCAAFVEKVASPDGDAWSAVRRIAGGARDDANAMRFGGVGRDIGTVISGMPLLVRNIYRRLVARRGPILGVEEVSLYCLVEQTPDPASRVTLAEQTDPLGMPRLRVDWRIGDLERRSVIRLRDAIQSGLQSAGLPGLKPNRELDDDSQWRAQFIDRAHPMGTTRMAAAPEHGVVDLHCRVHGIANLYVAGSSVFPTAGHGNPTLTIVALAIRLADRLKASHFAGSRVIPEAPLAHTRIESGDTMPDPQDGEARLPAGSRVAVTGATGFIGGRLVERLVGQGDVHVRCLNRDSARAVRLKPLPVENLDVDLGNAAAVRNALSGIDYVFHCAYDGTARRPNIEALRNLVAACEAHSVARLVHVSTIAVYQPFPDGPVTEGTPDGDRSKSYIDTKLDLERIVLRAVRKGRISATIVQPTIVYGPFCVPWTLVPAERLLFGEVVLPDQGEGICNAVHVDDLVDGMLLAAQSAVAVGERFILSGPAPVAWNDFYTSIAMAVGAGPPTFWPRERIAAARPEGRVKDIFRLVAPWAPGRIAVRLARDLQAMLHRNAGSHPGPEQGPGSPARHREVFVPDAQALALYCSMSVTSSAKAHSRIGYRPRVDFQRGMALTSQFLKEKYGQSGVAP